jgi:hypothetical protein
MNRPFTAVLLIASALIGLQSVMMAEVKVSEPQIEGWFESLEDAANPDIEGSDASLCITDETMVYYKMSVTVEWEVGCFPTHVKLKMYEEDTFSDDFIGDGILGEQENPGDPSSIFGGSHLFEDYICTSGSDLARKAGAAGEPGSEWELEVRVCYTLDGGGRWHEIDPPGWEFDQPFHRCG